MDGAQTESTRMRSVESLAESIQEDLRREDVPAGIIGEIGKSIQFNFLLTTVG